MNQPYPFGGPKAASGYDLSRGSGALGVEGCAAFIQKALPLFCK